MVWSMGGGFACWTLWVSRWQPQPATRSRTGSYALRALALSPSTAASWFWPSDQVASLLGPQIPHLWDGEEIDHCPLLCSAEKGNTRQTMLVYEWPKPALHNQQTEPYKFHNSFYYLQVEEGSEGAGQGEGRRCVGVVSHHSFCCLRPSTPGGLRRHWPIRTLCC